MATLYPNPFPHLNTPEMERPGRQVEYEVYKNLSNICKRVLELKDTIYRILYFCSCSVPLFTSSFSL